MASITRRSAVKLAAVVFGLGSSAILSPLGAEAAAGLKFEVYKDTGGSFRWRLKAANGKVIGTSGDGYKAKADCRNAIDLVKGGAAAATVVELP